jgi:hypothetical protein
LAAREACAAELRGEAEATRTKAAKTVASMVERDILDRRVVVSGAPELKEGGCRRLYEAVSQVAYSMAEAIYVVPAMIDLPM